MVDATQETYSYNIRIGPDTVTVLFVGGFVSAPGVRPFPVGTRTDVQALQAIADIYAAMPEGQFRAALGNR